MTFRRRHLHAFSCFLKTWGHGSLVYLYSVAPFLYREKRKHVYSFSHVIVASGISPGRVRKTTAATVESHNMAAIIQIIKHRENGERWMSASRLSFAVLSAKLPDDTESWLKLINKTTERLYIAVTISKGQNQKF